MGEQGAIEHQGAGEPFRIAAIQRRRGEQMEVHLLAKGSGIGKRDLDPPRPPAKPLLALAGLCAQALGHALFELFELIPQRQQLTGHRQLLIAVKAGKLGHHLQQGGAGLLVMPETILEQQQIYRCDLIAAIEESARLDKPYRLLPATIRHIATMGQLAVELLAQLIDKLETGIRQAHLFNLALPQLVLIPPDLQGFRQILVGVAIAGQHGLKVDRKSTRLNSSHVRTSRMPSSA